MNERRSVAFISLSLLMCASTSILGQPPLPTMNQRADSIAAPSSRGGTVAAMTLSEVDAVATGDRTEASIDLSAEESVGMDGLVALEAQALANNATLRRMRMEAGAAWAKTDYVSKLPDPTISSMIFAPPMTFEPDRQVAELQVMQMIPWLARLKAEGRQACFEAMAAQTDYQAERLRVVGDLRANWYRLYVIRRQVETITAEKAQIESLIQTANAQVRTGNAQPGDVLMATLELSSLQEQFLSFQQQERSTIAEMNRLLGKESSTSLALPSAITSELPAWTMETIRATARANQPELNAARLRTAAARWGIEVARLRRRPDLTFGVGWVAMDAPGATMPGAGRDSLTVGMSATIPIWHGKYNAMEAEASRQHRAAHASEDEIEQRLDAMLVDLWEQASAASETVKLYQLSILPQARQTLEANQNSLGNGTVSFDRVIRDYRTFINLQLGYEKGVGQLATALARLRQAMGTDSIIENN